MRRSLRSLGYALEGLAHAITTERNFRHFSIASVVVFLLAVFFGLKPWEWMALVSAGVAFMAVELLNTALERLVNACDELYKQQGRSHHHALKQTKDVAAGAALITLLASMLVFCFVFYDLNRRGVRRRRFQRVKHF